MINEHGKSSIPNPHTQFFFTFFLFYFLFLARMYRGKNVGVVRVTPHLQNPVQMDRYLHPQGLYDVLQPLMDGWPKSKCIAAWHGRDAFSMVFPNVHGTEEKTVHQLNVAVEEGGGRAFVRLNNSFLPVETSAEELEEAFPDHLLVVGQHCFVAPSGGTQALRDSIRSENDARALLPKSIEPFPTATATIVVREENSAIECSVSTKASRKAKIAELEKELKAAKRRASRWRSAFGAPRLRRRIWRTTWPSFSRP